MIYDNLQDDRRKIYARRYKFPTMVSQAGHTFDILYWTYMSVLEKHNISLLQYAILRRASHEGTPYPEIIAATGASKSTVWRQSTTLAERGIVRFGPPHHKRSRTQVIGFTNKGYALLRKIAADVEKELLGVIGVKEAWSKRAFAFTRFLWRANGFLPPNGLGDLKSFRRSRLGDNSVHPEPQLAPLPRAPYVDDGRPPDWK